MNLLFGFLIIVAAFIATPAMAETYELDGADITPMVDYYRSQIKTLKKPITTFSWSKTGGNEYWKKDHSDQEYLNIVQPQARIFWDNYGSKEITSTYGFGLYVAEDPIITRYFGGDDDNNWLLLRMQLPVGFKILQAGDLVTLPPDEKILPSLRKFGCSVSEPRQLLLSAVASVAPASCHRLMRKIFDEILEIDAFAYTYSATHLRGCFSELPLAQQAFVITRSDLLKSGSVRYFTASSRAHTEERILIQSISLSSEDYLKAETEDLATQNPPQKPSAFINSKESENFFYYPLLWKDLEGQKKSPSVASWLKKNKFGCTAQSPY